MILTFLTLYYVVGLEATLLPLLYVTTSLLFGLDNHLGYLHATVKFTLATSCYDSFRFRILLRR